MDVKSDNVFVDENCVWNLGDFGSTRGIGQKIWTFTEVFNPYSLNDYRTAVTPSMDFVLLCVMVAFELGKETWKKRLCGDHQQVQHDLILQCLRGIRDDGFCGKVVNLYNNHYEKVVQHLSTGSQ